MLISLHIENIATIKLLDVEFDYGFTVLTGQTGAGKSIIIDSVNLILGDKPNRGIIRSGENTATVSALFTGISPEKSASITSDGVECDGELIITREISESGRNLIKCNGRAVPAYMLKAITSKLISIHGQNASQTLLNSETHIHYLDSYAENGELLSSYKERFTQLQSLITEIKSLSADARDKVRRLEDMKRQIKEIEDARLKDGEEDELIASRQRIRNIEATAKYVKAVYRNLYSNEKSPSAIERLDNAVNALTALNETEKSDNITKQIQKLTDYRYEIEDIAQSTRALLDGIDEDPAAQLEKIEERLVLITRLKRKYGVDIASIKAYSASIKEQIHSIQTSDDRLRELNTELMSVKADTLTIASALTASRKSAAEHLKEKLEGEFVYLDLKKVRFEVSVNPRRELCENGADDVVFLISTNAGEELKPLQNVASGGELSRIMLSMKTVFADKDELDTVIYDEVDTGISGATSERIGQRLKTSSQGCQVIAITHSAQIAAQADNHILIYKEDSDDRTYTMCRTLDREERINEVARILGGVEITPKVTAAAREMINRKKD